MTTPLDRLVQLEATQDNSLLTPEYDVEYELEQEPL